MNATATNLMAGALLHAMAASFNHRASLKEFMRENGGWLDFSVGFRTEDSSVEQSIAFKGGHASVSGRIPANADATLIFKEPAVVKEMVTLPPNEVLNLLLKNRMRMEGNLTYVNLFNFYVALLMGKQQSKMLRKRKDALEEEMASLPPADPVMAAELNRRRGERLKGVRVDPGVKRLSDPYLSAYSIDDFPRLKGFVDEHFEVKPALCHERPKLLTDWFRANGFETDPEGRPWVPELRQAGAFRYLMENRKPLLREGDLLAGTTTTKKIGVVVYPDTHGTMIWGELKSARERPLSPYEISDETVKVFHEIFPFYAKRNMREWVRDTYDNPLSQQMDERFAVYFMWKTAALSHTIADFPRLLRRGTGGIIEDIDDELARDTGAGEEKKNSLEAMKICLEGLAAYAKNLSRDAGERAAREKDAGRKVELERIAANCAKVPERPAETLEEALQAIWIGWVGLHMESTNAGLSIGRMDQWLQPYFVLDTDGMSPEELDEYVKRAVELVGCFYMRCTDHLPLIPDIGNYLFGGSSSDQAITLGGVRPDGTDAVNDMTYIYLKVTEMLGIRDPNVNARYHPGVNSDAYLKRLCEVNLITAATPSMHNDVAVMESLEEFGYATEDLRDWSATGCVEPTLSGKHIGHTNCMMMNMVGALEMAMNDGRHPLMDWSVGPRTGLIEDGDFETFEDFFSAFEAQFKFLIDSSCEYNNMLGQAHSVLRPTPLLSSLINDCIANGSDATKGGARYNSSGAACIGLADVTDSLLVIKKLVFEEGKVTFAELKKAVDEDFEGHPALRAMAATKVPLFGSGSDEAVVMADRVASFAHSTYGAHMNFRGGPYTSGFWSMANHVAFGTLSGALPSGRLAGKAFTPGLTPEPNASKNLLDNIRDVAKLDPRNLNNNIAFNVKVVPAAGEQRERVVENMFSYVKTYFELGGMQMQMNVVTSAMLRDAMEHPEEYRNLLVRISGYNAYFVTLNKDMQIELIERAEYGI
jgi:formate C-acetyltransferase